MNGTTGTVVVAAGPSWRHASTNATLELIINLIHVNSIEDTVPRTRFWVFPINSLHANRRVAKHNPNNIGEVRLITIAKIAVPLLPSESAPESPIIIIIIPVASFALFLLLLLLFLSSIKI